MSATYLLRAVNADGTETNRGTGWYLRDTLVVTAGHVVTADDGVWLGDSFQGLTYRLYAESTEPVDLTPLAVDIEADAALLQAPTPASSAAVLELAPRSAPARDERWYSYGFPAFHDEKPFPLTGSITDSASRIAADALALNLNQGTRVQWGGVSGSPVLISDQVVGIITRVTDNTDTGWAAPAAAIRRLERFCAAVSFRDELAARVATLYASPEAIAELAKRLRFDAIDAHALDTAAGSLVTSIWRYGPGGFDRAVTEIRKNHPNDDAIKEIELRLLGHLDRIRHRDRDPGARLRAAKAQVADGLRRSPEAVAVWRDQVAAPILAKHPKSSDGFADALFELTLADLLKGAAAAQNRTTVSSTIDAICEAVETILPAMINEEQNGAVDYVLGSREDTGLALIELLTDLKTVAEIIMAAADGPHGFCARGLVSDSHRANSSSICRRKEVWMRTMSGSIGLGTSILFWSLRRKKIAMPTIYLL